MSTVDASALAALLRERAAYLSPPAISNQGLAEQTKAMVLRHLADELEEGLLSEEPDDRIAGAIDRLREALGTELFDTREVGMALNEAFRNGMHHAKEHPAEVLVHVPGLPYIAEDGVTTQCDWPATLVKDIDPHRDLPAYTVPAHLFALAQEGAPLPREVEVYIAGLAKPDGTNWRAVRAHAATPQRPIFTIVEGDPNGVAVGRFKASLRKFLGV